MRFEGPIFHPPAWKHPWYRGKITIWIRSGKETHNNSSSWHHAVGKSQGQESVDMVSQLQVWEGVRALSGSSASLLLPCFFPLFVKCRRWQRLSRAVLLGFNVRIWHRCADLGDSLTFCVSTPSQGASDARAQTTLEHTVSTPKGHPDPKGVVSC